MFPPGLIEVNADIKAAVALFGVEKVTATLTALVCTRSAGRVRTRLLTYTVGHLFRSMNPPTNSLANFLPTPRVCAQVETPVPMR